MGLDHTGTWHPKCDIQGCPADQDPEGIVEVDVPILGTFRTVRIGVCRTHLVQLAPADAFCAA